MRQFLVLSVVFAVFVKLNHCAFEELSTFFQKASDCCSADEDGHPSHSHNSPCAELSSLPHESSHLLAEVTKSLLPVDVFFKFALLSLNNGFVEYLQKISVDKFLKQDVYHEFFAKNLVISPNAPPVV